MIGASGCRFLGGISGEAEVRPRSSAAGRADKRDQTPDPAKRPAAGIAGRSSAGWLGGANRQSRLMVGGVRSGVLPAPHRWVVAGQSRGRVAAIRRARAEVGVGGYVCARPAGRVSGRWGRGPYQRSTLATRPGDNTPGSSTTGQYVRPNPVTSTPDIQATKKVMGVRGVFYERSAV